MRCATRIRPLESAAYAWLAAASPAPGGLAALLWVERPSERFELKFKTFDLDSPDDGCG